MTFPYVDSDAIGIVPRDRMRAGRSRNLVTRPLTSGDVFTKTCCMAAQAGEILRKEPGLAKQNTIVGVRSYGTNRH